MSEAAMRKIGIGLTVLVTLFWAMDSGMKLANLAPVAETMGPLGWPTDSATILTLGLIQAGSLALYLWPKSSVLGAILLTAYLGGATTLHVIARSGLFPIVFAIGFGVLVWVGLILREPRLARWILLRQ